MHHLASVMIVNFKQFWNRINREYMMMNKEQLECITVIFKFISFARNIGSFELGFDIR